MSTAFRREHSYFARFQALAATTVTAGQALHAWLLEGPITQERFQPLHDIEHQANGIAHELQLELARAFIVPLDVDDAYQLARRLDDMVDAIDDAGQIAAFCRIDTVPPLAVQLCDVITAISGELVTLVSLMEHARGSRHGGARFHESVTRAHALENEGDRVWSTAFAGLFADNDDPLYAIKWKDIYGRLEAAADAAEQAAQLIESIVYK